MKKVLITLLILVIFSTTLFVLVGCTVDKEEDDMSNKLVPPSPSYYAFLDVPLQELQISKETVSFSVEYGMTNGLYIEEVKSGTSPWNLTFLIFLIATKQKVINMKKN